MYEYYNLIKQMEQVINFNLPQGNYDEPLVYPLSILCSCGQLSCFICCTESCTNNAFICGQSQCSNRNKHLNCKEKITREKFIAQLQKQRKSVSIQIKQSFAKIIEKYEELIYKISEDRTQFVQFTEMLGLNQKCIRIVKMIKQGSYETINGQFLGKAMQTEIDKQSIYCPIRMQNYETSKIISADICQFLQSLAYELGNSQSKYNMIVNKFSETNYQTITIKRDCLHWEFIPFQIKLFTKLVTLDLNSNSIRKIDNLVNFSDLQYLNLSKNQIRKIENLGNLVKLKELILFANKIQKIENLNTLSQLTQLNLARNHIVYMENLLDLFNLKRLTLVGNPLQKTQNGVLQLEKLKTYAKLWLPKDWDK